MGFEDATRGLKQADMMGFVADGKVMQYFENLLSSSFKVVA